jgi:hypothetical protein
LRQEAERLHDQIRELTEQNRVLTTNLVARNDREFQFLYGNAPQPTVVTEAVQYDDEDDYTETVMDFREDAALLGLTDQPVGP